MKKFLSILFLLLMGLTVHAQKKYVTVYCNQNNNWVKLSGDIPQSMKNSYSSEDFPRSGSFGYYFIGDVLNLLADNGFSVEQMSTTSYVTSYVNSNTGSNVITTYLLSKLSNDSNPSNTIEKIKIDNYEDIVEVARYNLQGVPVNKNEKGIQIIVYSNFTTKTILVQ